MDEVKTKILDLKSTSHQKDLTALYLEAAELISDALETCDVDVTEAKKLKQQMSAVQRQCVEFAQNIETAENKEQMIQGLKQNEAAMLEVKKGVLAIEDSQQQKELTQLFLETQEALASAKELASKLEPEQAVVAEIKGCLN